MEAHQLMDTATFLQIAERFGVPVAFAVIMVLLLLYFANQHRAERGEWREFLENQIGTWKETIEAESKLNRGAISELSKVVSGLGESFAYLEGKLTGKRSNRK